MICLATSPVACALGCFPKLILLLNVPTVQSCSANPVFREGLEMLHVARELISPLLNLVKLKYSFSSLTVVLIWNLMILAIKICLCLVAWTHSYLETKAYLLQAAITLLCLVSKRDVMMLLSCLNLAILVKTLAKWHSKISSKCHTTR